MRNNNTMKINELSKNYRDFLNELVNLKDEFDNSDDDIKKEVKKEYLSRYTAIYTKIKMKYGDIKNIIEFENFYNEINEFLKDLKSLITNPIKKQILDKINTLFKKLNLSFDKKHLEWFEGSIEQSSEKDDLAFFEEPFEKSGESLKKINDANYTKKNAILEQFRETLGKELDNLKKLERNIDNFNEIINNISKSLDIVLFIINRVIEFQNTEFQEEIKEKIRLKIIEKIDEQIEEKIEEEGLKAFDEILTKKLKTIEDSWKKINSWMNTIEKLYNKLPIRAKELSIIEIENWKAVSFEELLSNLNNLSGILGKIINYNLDELKTHNDSVSGMNIDKSTEYLAQELQKLSDQVINLNNLNSITDFCKENKLISDKYKEWLLAVESYRKDIEYKINKRLQICNSSHLDCESLIKLYNSIRDYDIYNKLFGELCSIVTKIDQTIINLEEELNEKMTIEERDFLNDISDKEKIEITDIKGKENILTSLWEKGIINVNITISGSKNDE